MGRLEQFLSFLSPEGHSSEKRRPPGKSSSHNSKNLVKKGSRSKGHSRKGDRSPDGRGMLEDEIFRSSQDELEAMSMQMVHHLQANHVELHKINKPTDLLRHLTGLVELRNNTLNDLQHLLQQADAEVFNQRGELHKRGQDIERLKEERDVLETDLRNFRQYHDETVTNIESRYMEERRILIANHDDYVKALRRSHSGQQAQLESSYQKQIDVIKANHETFVLNEQHKHNEELKELKIQTKETVEKVEEAMRRGVDNFQAKPDRAFVLLFDELKAAVQNLITFEIDASTLQFDEIFKARCSELRLPQPNNVLLLQSYLWTMVIESIFKCPFRVFGAYGDRLAETWSLLFTQGKSRSHSSIHFG